MSSRKVTHRNYDNYNEDDDQWLFDSIVNYLKSPLWTSPIQQFIENNCAGKIKKKNFVFMNFYENFNHFKIKKKTTTTIITFVYSLKQKIVFSPEDGWAGGALLNIENEKDIPKQYRVAHKKYKELVDLLINTFIQDIGISYSEFVRACRNNKRLADHPVYIVIIYYLNLYI